MEKSNVILEGLLDAVAKDEKYDNYKMDIKQISSGGANYTGYLYQVSITEPGKEDLKIFAKVAAMGEKMRSIGTRVYKIESFFYNELIKKYRELEEKHSIPEEHRLLVPKFYGSNDEYMQEVLLLEDLTAKGFDCFDRFKSISWEQTVESVSQLAKLHALSLVLSKENVKEFEEVQQIIKINATNGKHIKEFLESIIPKVYESTKKEKRARVEIFFKESLNSSNFKSLYAPSSTFIIHGDYRPNNLMYQNNGKCQAIPLDFQTLRFGSPLYDLLYFINLGSDNAFRQKYFQATLDHYYAELCNALQRFNVDANVVYSKENFESEYKQILPFLVTISLCILLVVTVDEESAPKDLEELDLKSYAFTPNQRYREKLDELIDFYTEMGVL